MWVGDDLGQLKGLLARFCLAKPSIDHRRLLDSEEFALKQLVAGGAGATSWTTALRRSAPHAYSEIAQFFDWYERVSRNHSHVVAQVQLSDTERAHFMGLDMLQFRSLERSTLDSLSLSKSEYWGPTVRYHDGSGRTCYVRGMASIECGNALIANCRGAQAPT